MRIASEYTKKVATFGQLPASCDICGYRASHSFPNASSACNFFRGCAVNLFQVTGYRFIVSTPRTRRLLRAMCTAGSASRVDGINRFRKPFRPSTGDKDIVQPRFFSSSVHSARTLHLHFRPATCTAKLFLTIKVNTQSQNTAVDNPAVLPYFQDNTFKINNGINRIQRTVLFAILQLVDCGIGDFRYQRRRDVCIVHFFED